MDRRNRFYVEKTPKLVRCYDNGGQRFDRYTVVFTGRYRTRTAGEFVYLGMSAEPFHPQGFGQHGSSTSLIDRPRYGHLGRKIPFDDLPADCRRLVVSDYDDIWRLTS